MIKTKNLIRNIKLVNGSDFKKMFNASIFRFFSESDLSKWRNIGISAHIDSGKTTFTERVLFYSGKIGAIHEVKGSDGVGATMDFMELEREKGITIQSAATHLTWKDHTINLIDTPGHVDFTIEVERALRVLDGAVLIVCGVAGVQAQTFTVFKQMERYDVPRIIFINKLDRMGANPYTTLVSIQKKLNINAELIMLPLGEDSGFDSVIDIVNEKVIFFGGESGQTLIERPVPEDKKSILKERRSVLIEKVAEADEILMELYIEEKPISVKDLKDAIRRATLARRFSPVFMGSAYKNKGVQLALDGVIDYLPNPKEVENKAFLKTKNEETNETMEKEIMLTNDENDQFVCLAFKLDENRFGQLTFCRAYQGKLKRGDMIYNVIDNKKVKVSRLVRMHANAMEEIDETKAGDIFAIFGLECNSGTTFIKNEKNGLISLSSMFVPDPVMSVCLKIKNKSNNDKLHKALKKFSREDPTFTYNIEAESEELVISGMGELHLQIYAERLKREYGVDVELGAPTVNYRETIVSKIPYNYLHKKQSGGAGQFARIVGYAEPIFNLNDKDQIQSKSKKNSKDIFVNEFCNKIVGTTVPIEFITAVEKQFYESCNKGPITGYPIINTRFVLETGETHVVDSSGNAFATATKYALSQIFSNPSAVLLEPIMKVEINVPSDTYQPVMNAITKRTGNIYNTEIKGEYFFMEATVALSHMFGFASELRGYTQGQGEFSMEYMTHEPVPQGDMEEIIKKIKQNRKQN